MRKVQTLTKADGSTTYQVRFRHGVSLKTGKPLQTSEPFTTIREAQDFAKWLDALGPQGALDRLYESDQAKTVPTLDTVAADHIRLLTGIEEGKAPGSATSGSGLAAGATSSARPEPTSSPRTSCARRSTTSRPARA